MHALTGDGPMGACTSHHSHRSVPCESKLAVPTTITVTGAHFAAGIRPFPLRFVPKHTGGYQDRFTYVDSVLCVVAAMNSVGGTIANIADSTSGVDGAGAIESAAGIWPT